MSKRVRTIANIVSANRHHDQVYAVMTVYPETDALNAGGLILRSSVDRAGSYATLLRTNDSLQSIWVSAQGSLWAVSARGTVWTTATVAWSDPQLDWLDYTLEVKDHDWRIAPLPPLGRNGAQPVGQLIWGTTDQNLHVACFGGAIYSWNGSAWTERPSPQGPRAGFNGIHGDRPDNVYAVGDRGVIARFDGTTWTRIPLPEDAQPAEAYTGVRVLDSGDVIACGRGGTILHGNAGGFELLGSFPTAFYGISTADKRVILSAGDKGAFELAGNRIQSLVGKPLVGGFDGGSDMALFVEPAQEPQPSLVEFKPGAIPVWSKRLFPAPGQGGR